MLRLLPLLMMLATATADTQVSIATFAQEDLDDWDEKHFEAETHYSVVKDDGRRVLKAVSDGTASGMYKKMRIDLQQTPYLHWSWKVENTLGDIDEHTKDGDDYAARVYVVRSGGLFFWNTRAVNYVWSSNQSEGTTWKSPFTEKVALVALRSGAEHTGRWLSERRNVREDFRRLFGKEIRYVDAVAVMTDTDNSETAATAYYGDIYFTAQ